MKNTKLKIEQFNLLSNSQTHNVYAYNFSRKNWKHSRYKPLSLECRIKKSQVFNTELLSKITKNRLSLSIKKK